jgi:uncharacterized membrane protein
MGGLGTRGISALEILGILLILSSLGLIFGGALWAWVFTGLGGFFAGPAVIMLVLGIVLLIVGIILMIKGHTK